MNPDHCMNEVAMKTPLLKDRNGKTVRPYRALKPKAEMVFGCDLPKG